MSVATLERWRAEALSRPALERSDGRQVGKVEHTIRDLVRQRQFRIACGYVDCNHAARLAEDPTRRPLMGHDSLSGAALASQPTLSRVENAPRRADLYRMGERLPDKWLRDICGSFLLQLPGDIFAFRSRAIHLSGCPV